MDAYEATRVVFSRIQNLDPENASKIMGVLLIHDHGEKEMIRLAFGPESLVHSVILKARKELGISSNNASTPSTPSSSPSPFSLSRQNSSRLMNGVNLPSPLSIPNPPSSWAHNGYPDFNNPEDLISPGSYPTHYSPGPSSSTMNSAAMPFYGGGQEANLVDEFQLQDQLSFLNEGLKNPDLFYPQPDLASSPNGDGMHFNSYGASWGGLHHHRRSCSVSDICLGGSPDDPAGGFGWKPCLYFQRGYCKNGASCRFLHGSGGELDGGPPVVGSPTSKLEMMEQCQELLRSKSAHQQRLAAASQLMASANFGNYLPATANKCMNFLLQQQNDSPRAAAAAAALMMGDDIHKFGRTRLERNEFVLNPGSRQIYLTFPADSTFREEDVSNYFSIYGPVQDVRIPYQQKRMFGFVTFVYPETVKLILAKGNPHFVCDARVLVKPYKEKGKVPEKYRKLQQPMERGEFGSCGSPTGVDSRDPFDVQLGGGRMFMNTQDVLWKRKLEEQADLQQAIELQNRRLIGLQLLDVKRHNHHRALSSGAAIPSPTHSPSFFNQSVVHSSDPGSPPDIVDENGLVSAASATPAATSTDQQVQQTANVTEGEKESSPLSEDNGNDKSKGNPHAEESDLHECLHNLPDNLFASPKAAGNYMTAFSNDMEEAKKSTVVSIGHSIPASSLLPASSTLDMASLKSCYFQAPRFASGHGAIGM